jgi:hypothetical protein
LKLQRIVTRALEETAELWPAIRQAYAGVHQAGHILNNAKGHAGVHVRLRLHGERRLIRAPGTSPPSP